MEFKIYVQIFKHVLSWKKIDFNRIEYERGIRILAPKDLTATIFDWDSAWKTSNLWDRIFDSAILMFVTVKGSRFDNSDYLKHEDVDVNEFKLG